MKGTNLQKPTSCNSLKFQRLVLLISVKHLRQSQEKFLKDWIQLQCRFKETLRNCKRRKAMKTQEVDVADFSMLFELFSNIIIDIF